MMLFDVNISGLSFSKPDDPLVQQSFFIPNRLGACFGIKTTAAPKTMSVFQLGTQDQRQMISLKSQRVSADLPISSPNLYIHIQNRVSGSFLCFSILHRTYVED